MLDKVFSMILNDEINSEISSYRAKTHGTRAALTYRGSNPSQGN